MDSSTLVRLRESLQTRREVLTNWLKNAPPEEKQVRLGPADERAVEAHVETVQTAIQKAENETLGICTICHDPVEPPGLLEMDYTACICLSHLSPDEVSQLESELELAQTVQRALLPHQAPAIPGVEVAAFSRPAQILGGDFIDFPLFRDGAYGLLIGDVAGHGVSAGLLMASVQASARSLALDADSPAQVLQRVNDVFLHNVNMTTFVTLFLAHFNPKLRALTYSNAGHNPPLIFRGRQGNSEVTWLDPTNAAIGLIEGTQFKARTVSLRPGDLVLLYTDGVTEAMNAEGDEFGAERLAASVDPAQPARTIVLGLQQKLQEFTAGRPLADDTTIVACCIRDEG